MITATNIATKLNNTVVSMGKTAKAPKGAQVKDFTKAEVVVVPTELEGKMAWAGKRYKAIMATRAKQYTDLVEIGHVVLAYRNLHKSDKEFGRAIKATSLKVISQQDRNELMWLASNVDAIAKAREAGTVTSWSVGVIRKQMRELDKANKADKTPKGVTAKSTGSKAKSAPTASMAEQRDGMAHESVKQMTAKDYATIVASQILESGMDQDEFLKELKAALI